MTRRRRAERFASRTAAGRALGTRLSGYADDDPLIVGLPRGGVVVAAEVARALAADLDALGVAKVGMPGHQELAAGAVGEDGSVHLNRRITRRYGLADEDLAPSIDAARSKISTSMDAIRGHVPPLPLQDRHVIIVDDGLATGATAHAAIMTARAAGATAVTLAVPVGAPETIAALAAEADEVVSLEVPADFVAVGFWYDDFSQTTTAEVVELLREARSQPADGHA